MNRNRLRLAATAMAAVALAAACSTKSSTSSGTNNSGTNSSAAGGSVKTDFGVTSDTITLGILTDLHGVFASLGTSITNANQLYWKEQNDKGGICNRKVKLVVKDHGYDVQQAVPLYQQLKGEVLSLQQTLGSPINTALLNNFTQDQMLSIPSAWASTLLRNDYIMDVGSTYDFEMINGVDYLLSKGKIKAGDKIGHIYFEGEYGANGLLGSKFAASKNNLTVIEEKIKATDKDVTAQVTDLKNQGAKAILLTAGPLQSASAASVAASIGYNVPILSNNPGFAPGLMQTPAAAALVKNFYIVIPWAQPSTDNAAAKAFIAAYKAAYPGKQIDGGITWAYGASDAYRQVLSKACDNKDLTRKGIHDAFRSLTNVSTNGVVVPLDYSKKGDAPSHQAYIWRPSTTAEGGLVKDSDLYEGKDVSGYQPPGVTG